MIIFKIFLKANGTNTKPNVSVQWIALLVGSSYPEQETSSGDKWFSWQLPEKTSKLTNSTVFLLSHSSYECNLSTQFKERRQLNEVRNMGQLIIYCRSFYVKK
jgi:hypothetical protein